MNGTAVVNVGERFRCKLPRRKLNFRGRKWELFSLLPYDFS